MRRAGGFAAAALGPRAGRSLAAARGGRVLAAALVAASLFGPGPLAAQDVARPCDALDGDIHASCVESALALQAARAAIGLAAAGGADVPGTNSTLGKRLGSTPRFALALRAGLTRAPTADLGAGVPADDGSAWLTSLRGDAAFGLFGGFSAAPTVGGILAVDLLGTAALVRTPGAEDGFGGGNLSGLGVGVRVGVVRESFTLPGITLTATRRWLGETRIGTITAGDAGGRGAEFETTVTSVRGVVGKDFFAVGVLAGAGWDRYQGDASIHASASAAPEEVVDADDLTSDRMVVFGGLSWNFLVLQLAAEGGWAGGFDAPAGRGDGFDPGRGSFFGGVSLRLIL